MLEKNYSNPEGIGRFSFSESGSYRAPYKAEGVVVFLTVIVALILEGALISFSLTLLHEMMMDYDGDIRPGMFLSMASAIVIAVGSVIIIIIAGLILAKIFGGMSCKYSATEDKFMVVIGGDTHVIKYAEVQSIVFIPKYFIGKVKGYDVEITVANKIENYGVSFRGQFQSEKSTPFYIIKERLEILERQRNDELALYEQQKIGADKPVTQNEIDRARLRKQHESDIFPPNSNYKEKMSSVSPDQAPEMDSIAPRSTSRPKMAGVSAESIRSESSSATQMPELRTRSSSSAPWNSNNSSGNSDNISNSAGMAEIAPKHARPSEELFSKTSENSEAELGSDPGSKPDNDEELKKNQNSSD